MFHANCWGLALTSPMVGATMVMPGAKLDGASIYELLDTYRVSFTAAVPTVWLMLLQHLEANNLKLPYLKKVVIGGSACPRAMMQKFQDDYGVEVMPRLGHDRDEPARHARLAQAGICRAHRRGAARRAAEAGPSAVLRRDENHRRRRQRDAVGRQDFRPAESARPGGRAAPISRKRPACSTPKAFSIPATSARSTATAISHITDRSKDVIKSGGEWISSIELENLAVGHPKVAEAAVIGVRHPKWDERPLLVVVLKEGQTVEQGRDARLPRGQGRQMVDAGRRRLRQRDPAHRDRQDPEDRVARAASRITCCRPRRRDSAPDNAGSAGRATAPASAAWLGLARCAARVALPYCPALGTAQARE